MSDMLKSALAYALVGWAVFPLHTPAKTGCSCGKVECSSIGKHPRTPKGCLDASTDADQIRAWWQRWPTANIGLATGKISGLWVLDVDSQEGIDELCETIGTPPATRCAITGRGWHYYFEYAEGLKNRAGIVPGVDVRADGGYVVAPPSLHSSGVVYEWAATSLNILKAPRWLLNAALPPKEPARLVSVATPAKSNGAVQSADLRDRYDDKAIESEENLIRQAPPGTRNGALNKGAYALAGLGISGGVIADRLGAAARAAGLPQREIDQTLRGAIAKGAQRPRTVEPLQPNTSVRGTYHNGQAQPDSVPNEETAEVDPRIAAMNKRYAVVSVGNNVAILREAFDPDLGRVVVEYLNERSVGTLHANERVTIGDKTVNLAQHWLRHPQRRQYDRVIFAPGNDDPRYYNLWRGWAVAPKEGQWSLYRKHLIENICSNDLDHFGYLLDWMADAVQNPTKRPGVALVLRGKRGVGKGKLWEHFSALFGQHALQVQQARQLTGNFNAHLESCLLLNANEAFWAGDKGAEGALKGLITEAFITIERKGIDARAAPNRVRIIIDGNEEWIVPSGPEERRYFVLDVGDAHIQDAPYFAAIDEEMISGGRAALLHDLMHLDLTGRDLRAVPQTDGLLQQKLISLHPIPRFWLARLHKGTPCEGREWADPVPTAEIHRAYIAEAELTGERRRKVEMEFSSELGRLCPGLVKRRETVEFDDGDSYSKRTTKQAMCFNLPPLDKCREAFSQFLRAKIAWDS